jgi:hypothetical protein
MPVPVHYGDDLPDSKKFGLQKAKGADRSVRVARFVERQRQRASIRSEPSSPDGTLLGVYQVRNVFISCWTSVLLRLQQDASDVTAFGALVSEQSRLMHRPRDGQDIRHSSRLTSRVIGEIGTLRSAVR